MWPPSTCSPQCAPHVWRQQTSRCCSQAHRRGRSQGWNDKNLNRNPSPGLTLLPIRLPCPLAGGAIAPLVSYGSIRRGGLFLQQRPPVLVDVRRYDHLSPGSQVQLASRPPKSNSVLEVRLRFWRKKSLCRARGGQ